MPTTKRFTRKTQPAFIESKPDTFWAKVGIYPPAVKQFNTGSEGRAAIKRAIALLGRGNLRTLCEAAKLAHKPDQGEGDLADILINNSDQPTLLHLREFLKRKSEWVDKTFTQTLSSKQCRSHQTSVQQLGKSNETLKPLTKLLLLYRKIPQALLNIFVYDIWSRRSTSFEYSVDSDDVNGASDLVTQNVKRLISRFEQVTSHGVSQLVSHKLPDGLTVWILLREYPSKVRRDYHSQYNVVHDCGLIVLGYNPEENRLHFRSGNKHLAGALRDFFSIDLSVKLKSLRDQVYSGYDSDRVRAALMGEYDDQHDLNIVEASFMRSSLPGRGPISLELGFMQKSIKEALTLLNATDHSLLDIRGPADIKSLTVTYGSHSARVTSEVVKGGAVRFTFENAGWTTEEEQEFEEAFLATFELPLNRLIDPSVVSLGNVGLFAYLLTVDNAEDIEGYHQESFDFLCEQGFLRHATHNIQGCQNNFCSERNKPVGNEKMTTCKKCDNPLEQWTITGVKRNEVAILNLVKQVFDCATGLVFDKSQRTLEGRRYYAQSKQGDGEEDDILCVMFADRPSMSARQVFERASRPMIVVQPHTDGRKVYVDFDNVGHVSLAYLIAAQEDSAEKKTCDQLCKDMVQRLLLTNKERVEKAARHSHTVLTNQRDGLNGDRYEIEIFNLLRAIFPSFRLGRKGKEEPDGFTCIPDYRDIENLEDVGSWNFTYDAKYSEKDRGYAFGAEERRQMLQYINRFSRNKQVLVGRNGKSRAHIIVTNNLAEKKMKAAAKFLYGKDGLKGKAREVRLVLMKEEFIVHLFEWVQGHARELAQKRPYLYEALITLLETDVPDGYLSLGQKEAESVVQTLQSLQVIENRISKTNLVASLDSKQLLI